MDEHDNFFLNFYFYPPGLKQSINYKESSDCFFHGLWKFTILM